MSEPHRPKSHVMKIFKWQIKNDPVATAAFDRTDGFIPAEEYAERLRQRRESPTKMDDLGWLDDDRE